jgi:hypothetical protein
VAFRIGSHLFGHQAFDLVEGRSGGGMGFDGLDEVRDIKELGKRIAQRAA